MVCLMAFSMNWTAIAASNKPITRMAMLMAMGVSQRAPRTASRKIK